jgi:hypothetical protein
LIGASFAQICTAYYFTVVDNNLVTYIYPTTGFLVTYTLPPLTGCNQDISTQPYFSAPLSTSTTIAPVASSQHINLTLIIAVVVSVAGLLILSIIIIIVVVVVLRRQKPDPESKDAIDLTIITANGIIFI